MLLIKKCVTSYIYSYQLSLSGFNIYIYIYIYIEINECLCPLNINFFGIRHEWKTFSTFPTFSLFFKCLDKLKIRIEL